MVSPPGAVAQPNVLGVSVFRGYPDGVDAERGITLAVEEINAKGGVDVAEEMRPLNIETMDTRELEPGVLVAKALLGKWKIWAIRNWEIECFSSSL